MSGRDTITDSAPPNLRCFLRKHLKATYHCGVDRIALLKVDPRIEQGVSHSVLDIKAMLDR